MRITHFTLFFYAKSILLRVRAFEGEELGFKEILIEYISNVGS